MHKRYYVVLSAVFMIGAPIWCLANIVLVSAPGSGKGTLSQYLVERYGYEHICLGDMVRQEIAAQTALGIQAKPLLERGEYISDSVALDIIAPRIMSALSQHKPFILDGFPRSITSFSLLHVWFAKNCPEQSIQFVQLKVSDAVCIDRVLHRIVCGNCLKVYNTLSAKPLVSEVCDACGRALSMRSSDKAHIIEQRLRLFHEQIEPVIDRARHYYAVRVIRADQSLNELKNECDTLLD